MLSRRRLLQSGVALPAASQGAAREGIQVLLQTRDRANIVRSTRRDIDPKKTAVLLVDAWHYHWCRTWRSRAGSLVPRINQSLDGARNS